jgi:hypothetical protein
VILLVLTPGIPHAFHPGWNGTTCIYLVFPHSQASCLARSCEPVSTKAGVVCLEDPLTNRKLINTSNITINRFQFTRAWPAIYVSLPALASSKDWCFAITIRRMSS